MSDDGLRLVVDTNIFVAAAFNPNSRAAGVLARVRDGTWTMTWCAATRRETRAVLSRIPPISWDDAVPLFRDEDRFDGPTDPAAFSVVEDPDDRKFAALAAATDAVLVSNDDHLLAHRDALEITVLTSGELMRRHG